MVSTDAAARPRGNHVGETIRTDEIYLTPAGFADLTGELERLRTSRAQAGKRLSEAMRVEGDSAETAEFLDAQRDEEMTEQRIRVLEERLASARLIDVRALAQEEVALGSWAKLEDLDSRAQSRFEVVSSAESNPSQGRISIESPVGKAIFGRHPGETVEVITPKGRRHLKVLAIEPHDESASRLPPGPPHPS